MASGHPTSDTDRSSDKMKRMTENDESSYKCRNR
jgi:hypothetical protein